MPKMKIINTAMKVPTVKSVSIRGVKMPNIGSPHGLANTVKLKMKLK